MRHSPPHLAALCAALLVAGCGGEAPEARASGARQSTFNMSLATVNESGIQGLVTVSPGQDALTLKMELMGLTGGETYTAALLTGTCQAPGEEVAELNPATSGSIGIGSSTTPVPLSELGGDRSFVVQARTPDGTAAACGSVPPDQLPD